MPKSVEQKWKQRLGTFYRRHSNAAAWLEREVWVCGGCGLRRETLCLEGYEARNLYFWGVCKQCHDDGIPRYVQVIGTHHRSIEWLMRAVEGEDGFEEEREVEAADAPPATADSEPGDDVLPDARVRRKAAAQSNLNRRRRRSIAATSYDPTHDRLADQLAALVRDRTGAISVERERDWRDLTITFPGRAVIVEVKVCSSALRAIREGLGQLLSYSFLAAEGNSPRERTEILTCIACPAPLRPADDAFLTWLQRQGVWVRYLDLSDLEAAADAIGSLNRRAGLN
jgi:hypothetical protein